MSAPSFSEWFEERFGEAFPLPRADALTFRLDDTLWCDRSDVDLPPTLRVSAARPAHPGPYTIAGAWGHGLDARAFHYLRRDTTHDVRLRLKHGGAYQDAASGRAEVLDALRGLSRWSGRFAPWLVELRATVDLYVFNARATLEVAGASHVVLVEGDELRRSPYEPALRPGALWAELDARVTAALGIP